MHVIVDVPNNFLDAMHRTRYDIAQKAELFKMKRLSPDVVVEI